MMIEERHKLILEELKANPSVTVKELSKKLFVSEPTIRRDFTELHNKGIITKIHGGAIINTTAAYREIPFFLRENEKSIAKSEMGRRAAAMIEDGMVIMLDGSTSAYHIVPFLSQFKNLTVITSGAKTAVALAESNIRTFCTGGQMIIHSFSYVGKQAEDFVKNVNADILFFSCHGLDEKGRMTDNAIEEANIRRVMFEQSEKKILLCDSSKLGKTYFYNMGNISDIDDVISDVDIFHILHSTNT
ncbi:MAG: DeoR/GlpR transcriptional regulator [Ruminococcaceae bacterium]|nr:DeoR/GlpR transcriptional regulator [Oscillospiraceae bacterium]